MGHRLAQGGHIDRAQPLGFRWNGRPLTACAGDTVASALLASDVAIVGRSMKFHRPRGILAAGVEEPNALVTLGRGPTLEPNARATLVPVREGLEVRAQHAWPSVDFDLGRVFDWTSGLWPAGFYNKTFQWPSWKVFEPFVRRAAGLGPAPRLPDPARYESVDAHCDLLIVGGGPAGLMAAQIAVRAGLRVVLAEQDTECGTSLFAPSLLINDAAGGSWVASVVGELAASRNVTLLAGTTAFGLYDHGCAGLVQRLDAGRADAPVRERCWRLRAGQVLLATGAIEQPLPFGRNDLPGVLLAGAIRSYANRYAVAAGRRIAFATNNDSAYLAALELADAGVEVPILIDCRPEAPRGLAAVLRERDVMVATGSVVLEAVGRRRLRGLRFGEPGTGGSVLEVECDALGVSGGWMPAVHLYSHARGALRFDEARQCLLPPGDGVPVCAGSVTGTVTLTDTIADAVRAAGLVLLRAGITRHPRVPRPRVLEANLSPAAGAVPRGGGGRRRVWIDFQHDVTAGDVRLAIAEGYGEAELLKRYTTAGMAPDQGKTSNLNMLLLAAEISQQPASEFGATTFRPPYTPVTLGAIAGRLTGERYAPRRHLPAHADHEARGAHWWEAGGWMRPACYLQAGETPARAVPREAAAVRAGVGLFDASPLGKIEVTGPDALAFLDRFYVNNLTTLAPGRMRYGLMLNENGVIIDDGTIARLDGERFVLTTTSGNAARIAHWLEEWRQCEWPQLEVLTMPVTTQWATVAVSGPRARELLKRLDTDLALDGASFPHLSVREGEFAGVAARLCRVSFSGELGYEVNVPARYGAALWRTLLAAGEEFGVVPYGIETLLLLRLEKGFLDVGVDTDGTTTPDDVGWGEIAARKPGDFIGRRSLARPDNRRADRLQLVGLHGDARTLVPGAHLRLAGTREGTDGWITSAGHSPAVGRPVALAMLRGGRARTGERVTVHDLDRRGEATVVSTPFYDPQGRRLHA